jgi:hypothetical protein
MNPEDDKRDKILRFLYERHKKSRGISKIPVGIQELQREMKTRYALTQPDVSSNLEYLIQVGWVREIVADRSFMDSAIHNFPTAAQGKDEGCFPSSDHRLPSAATSARARSS